MSDRLAVMNRGNVEQLGTPSQVYEEPETSYIADFLGLSNLMTGEAGGSDGNGGCRVSIGGRDLVAHAGRIEASGPVSVCIRPERVVLGGVGNDVEGVVDRVVYMGSMLQVVVDIDGVGELQVIVPNQGNGFAHDRGEPITLGFPREALRILA